MRKKVTILLCMAMLLSTTYLAADTSNDVSGQPVPSEKNGSKQVTDIDYNVIQASVQLPTGMTSPTQLYLQMQDSPITGYKNLSIEPFETNIQEIGTPEIPAGGGAYKLGNAWITDVLPEARDLSGPWDFNIFGKISGSTGNGTLRAEVYSLTNGWLFSAPSTESVAGHSTYHNFTWTHDVPEGMEIPANDRIFVEFWLDATSGGAISGQTINPDFDTNSSGWTYYEWGEWVYPWGFWQPTDGNPNGNIGVSFIHGPADIIIDNGGYWEQSFTPTSTPSLATLEFDWRCGISPTTMTVYVFIDSFSGAPNPSNAVWSQPVTGTTPWTSIGPMNISSIIPFTTYYLKIGVWAVTYGGGDDYNVTFDNVGVTWTMSPAPKFTLGYDYVSTPSSISMFLIESNPLPATNVHAELTGTNDVTIYWTSSASPFVAYYHIYCVQNGWDPTGDSYLYLGNTTGTSYTHNAVGNMSGNDYCYQIRAFDFAGHYTKTITQAAKFTKQISTSVTVAWGGWITLGSSLVQSSYALDFKLQGQGFGALGYYNWSAVELFNAWDSQDSWKLNVRNATPGQNEITTINNTQGFWACVYSSARYTSAGYVSNLTIPLKAGWNLVPYPFTARFQSTQYIRDHLIANCPGFGGAYNDMEIMRRDNPYRLTTPTGSESLFHQDALWVRVTADTIWAVNNY